MKIAMKNLTILFASLILFACGGSDSSESKVANPIDEAADVMHDALDDAQEVGAIVEQQKQAMDEALEEAEGAGPE
jgi:hypothetical protein